LENQQGGVMVKPSTIAGGENIAIMTVRDVAIYLRLSEAKVYRLAKEGHVPSFRCGKSWRFRRDLLDEWIINKTQHVLKEVN
jgi:excisionase family DNA binding protein